MKTKGTIRLPAKGSDFPSLPGVYLWKDANARLLYVGKASNLRRRLQSYMRGDLETRIAQMVREASSIEYIVTGTVIEALILEARLIKELQPRYNIRDKDDKSFYEIEITDDDYPVVHLVRETDAPRGRRYGPFTSPGAVKTALQIIRRIFPYNTHSPAEIERMERECVQCEIGLCPGVCAGRVTKKDYARTIRNIRDFFEGRKKNILARLEREMRVYSRAQEYEKAGRIKNQIFAIKHINDVALINEPQLVNGEENVRIEGYDISHISGSDMVGVMVVFENGDPIKSEYRKFRIKTVSGPNDTAALKEVISRRLGNKWPLPRLFLIDGGVAQVNAVKGVLEEVGVEIPVVGLAKGLGRDKNEVVGEAPSGVSLSLLVRVRDEAHRFAVSYHRKLRSVIV